ncbi:unnamed protein product [Meganyctiphanes norvegica]|uniref:Single domain-containing protein n=1 Tax=Meganyctiphanes norvegica TaxID=48144 RepID=A0AAV2Q744_MEGNR
MRQLVIQFKHSFSSQWLIYILVLVITDPSLLVEAQMHLNNRPVRESHLTNRPFKESLSPPEFANGRLLPNIGQQDFYIERPRIHQRPQQLSDFELHFSNRKESIPRVHGIEQVIADHEKRFKTRQEQNHRINLHVNSDFSDENEKILTSRGTNSDQPIDSQEDRSLPKFGIPKSTAHLFDRPAGGGCDSSEDFHMAGDVWYTRGCRRHKCVNFRGESFIETDQCDTEIYNTVYKCIIQVDLKANFPHCCPRFKCNPDNLGNKVPEKDGKPTNVETIFNIGSIFAFKP